MSTAKQVYSFPPEFQDLLLACIIRCPAKFLSYQGIIKPQYFQSVPATVTAKVAFDFNQKFGRMPSFGTLFDLVDRESKRVQDSTIVDYVKKLQELDVGDADYAAERAVAFARERATYLAVIQAVAKLKDGDTSDFSPLFTEAANIGTNLDDLGYVLHADVDSVVDKLSNVEYGTLTGYPALDHIWRRGWLPGWLIVPLAPPKRYKCLGKGTPIRMYDGSIKAVEDIQVGDKIMGDDSTPRTVSTCGRGRGPLYRVKQSHGIDFVCNDVHILCVRDRKGNVREIEAKDYAKLSPGNRKIWAGYKTGVEFSERSVPLDPYYFGLWLGDGCSHGNGITVADADPEIKEYFERFANERSCLVHSWRGQGCALFRAVRNGQYRNPVTDDLKQLGVLRNKRIPDLYKINSRAVRLNLLAGLLDSDGHLCKTGGFVFVNSNGVLAKDVEELARSLGFKVRFYAVKSKCTSTAFEGLSYRVIIGGSISDIPTKVSRKKAIDTEKSSTRCQITLENIGEGDYYGFTIDGNCRFVLGDGTVTHNTAFCLNLALNMVGPAINSPVFYYPCEISQELAMARLMCNLAKETMDTMYDNPDKFKLAVKRAMQDRVSNYLVVKSFPSGGATIGDIDRHVTATKRELGISPKAIFIDYAETIAYSPDVKNMPEYQQQASIYTQARALACKHKCPVIMPDRVNRETVDKPVPNMTSFQGAFRKAGIVDVALGLCATEQEYTQNILRTFVFVNRHGAAMEHFRGSVDPSTMTIDVGAPIPYDAEDNASSERGNSGRRRRQRDIDDRLAEED